MKTPIPKLEQRDDGWWVVVYQEDVDDMGPYDTKKEATECLWGLKRFLRYKDTLGFVTEGDV